MFRKIDESRFLSRLLQNTSNALARQRGLPVVIGIVLIFLSLIAQSLNVAIDHPLLAIVGIILHHVGVLIAIIGLLISIPLGK